MATAQDIVTRAFRRLQAIDLNEQPSAAEMTNGLAALSEMVNAWAADGIPTETQALTGTLVDDSPNITDLDTTVNLAPGHNISGTGVPSGARIKSILSATSVAMTVDATASGSAVALTFALMPIDDRHQKAVVALLAVYMAGDSGYPDAPPRVVRDAEDGWNAILAHYIQTPTATYDAALVQTSSETVLSLFGD